MIFFYGLCYYYGKNKLSNIVNHHKCIQELRNVYKDSKFSMILNVMIDTQDTDIRDNISENLKKTIFDLTGETIIVLNNFNYGGTIAGLYDTFSFLKSYCEFDCYIIYFEEDFYPINMNFLSESLKYLPTNIYVGETTKEIHSYKEVFQRDEKKLRINNIERWTDGGFYFSSLHNFKVIESKIGTFHKGDKNKKYDHQLDGIDIGEVGFPTLIYKENLPFIGLPRHLYFIHNE